MPEARREWTLLPVSRETGSRIPVAAHYRIAVHRMARRQLIAPNPPPLPDVEPWRYLHVVRTGSLCAFTGTLEEKAAM